MEDIHEFLAGFEGSPEARNLHGVRAILEGLQARLDEAKEDKEKLRPFPLLSERGVCGSIPWWVAEQAYITYAGRYGNEQSLERLAERGGFGISEMDEYFPEWRDRCGLITQLQAQLDTANKALASMNARWCNRVDRVTALHAQLAKAENQSFGNVLAIIHRDGGRYVAMHGHKKASDDAIAMILAMRAEIEKLREELRWIPVEERLPDKGTKVDFILLGTKYGSRVRKTGYTWRKQLVQDYLPTFIITHTKAITLPEGGAE